MAGSNACVRVKRGLRCFADLIVSGCVLSVLYFVKNLLYRGVRIDWLTVIVVDLAANNDQDWAKKQVDMMSAYVRVINAPQFPDWLKIELKNKKTIFIYNGMLGKNGVEKNAAVFFSIPKQRDLADKVTFLIHTILWKKVFRKEYFTKCRTIEESNEIAIRYVESVLRDIEPVVKTICCEAPTVSPSL